MGDAAFRFAVRQSESWRGRGLGERGRDGARAGATQEESFGVKAQKGSRWWGVHNGGSAAAKVNQLLKDVGQRLMIAEREVGAACVCHNSRGEATRERDVKNKPR